MTDLRPDRCETCTWWSRGAPRLSTGFGDASATPHIGTCQNRTPEVFLSAGPGFPISIWPETHAHRFCGDWVGEDEVHGPDGGEEVGDGQHDAVVPIGVRAKPRPLTSPLTAAVRR
jgi:hypothetical protein